MDLKEEAVQQAKGSGRSLIIGKNIESQLINYLMLDRASDIDEIYETNMLHCDARFVNYDHFTGLQVATLYKSIKSVKYFIANGASTSLTNVVGRNALWYVSTKNNMMDGRKLNNDGLYDDGKENDLENSNVTITLDKLLFTAQLARTPDNFKLEDAYKKLELAKILRFRFNELQNYQDLNDFEPMPEKEYATLIDIIINDRLNDFKEYLNHNNANKKDCNEFIYAPIINSHPFLKRTYLSHEIFKRIHQCPKICSFYRTLPNVGDSPYRNFIDSNGREADYYLSLEYLELAQEMVYDDDDD